MESETAPLSAQPEFCYRAGVLHAEAVALDELADRLETPFYCYSDSHIRSRYGALTQALSDLDPILCYSLKANPNLAVVATLAALGAGADVVSGGELKQALAAGIPADRIVFSGVGKTRNELTAAVAEGIRQINVESAMELGVLEEVARQTDFPAPVALRVNPDVAAKTHAKISTGRKAHKFGVDLDAVISLYRRICDSRWLIPRGLSVHIGSQLLHFEPFTQAFERIRDLVEKLRSLNATVDSIDLGGGIGIRYADEDVESLESYAHRVRQILAPLDCQLLLEPGRSIVGNAGLLVTRVLYVKESQSTTFVVVDAAMNDLQRPALYGARHSVIPVWESDDGAEALTAEIVGPVCETSDLLATAVKLPAISPGDLLAIGSCGAYAASMASSYNSRLIAAEVMVRGAEAAVVRQRQTYQQLIEGQQLPSWMQ